MMQDQKNDFNEINGRFVDRCRDAGLKVTPQRLAIYDILSKSKEHPSAEMVFQQARKALPHISLDTVNRTLLTLTEIGAAFIVEGSGEPKRFDANLNAHLHFKCIKCRKIIDFRHEPFEDIKIPANFGGKFKVLRTTVYCEGLCNICSKGKEN